jgi:hypothetical protein
MTKIQRYKPEVCLKVSRIIFCYLASICYFLAAGLLCNVYGLNKSTRDRVQFKIGFRLSISQHSTVASAVRNVFLSCALTETEVYDRVGCEAV